MKGVSATEEFIYSVISDQAAEVLIYFSDDRKYIKIHDIAQEKAIYSKEFGAKEDVVGATVVRKSNHVVFGSATGVVRVLDCSRFADINADMEVTALPLLESGVQTVVSSAQPDQKFVAIGTLKGHVHVYESSKLLLKYKYHDFASHHLEVTGIEFFQRGVDYMVASCS